MMKILKTVKIILPALVYLSLLAAESDLTLEKARQLALENNPQVKLAREAVNKAQYQVSEARAGLLPTLNAFSSYQHAWEIPTVIFNDMAFKMGSENTAVMGLDFKQPLFVGGAIWSGYQMSRHGRNISQSQLQSVIQNILLDVTNSYYGVLFANAVVDVMKQGLDAAQKNLEQVQKFRANGKASDFDVLRSEVQVANFKPQVVSAVNNARMAKSRLLMVLGIDDQTQFEIVDKLVFEANDLSGSDLEELVLQAMQSRPEISMLKEQQDIALRQLSIARASYMPSLILGTSYQYQGQKNDMDFSSDDFYKSFNSSLSISIPIFSGLKNSARVQQAKISIREAGYQEESLIQGLKLEVESTYFKVQEAEENVVTQSKIIASAEEAMRLANLRYAEGASTQLEVLNTEVALNQSRLNYQRTLFEYNTALASLKKALNQL